MIEKTITCIGSSYAQSIADLVVNLHERQPKFGYMERDYAISIILLSAAMFESYMVRAAYLRLQPEELNRIPASLAEKAASGRLETGSEIFRKFYPDYAATAEVNEAYVLRDSLTHNHLWEFRHGIEGGEQALRRIFGGNSSFLNNVDFDSLRTKALGLPVVPGKQDWNTASKFFMALWRAWEYIQDEDGADVISLGASFNVRVPKNTLPQLANKIAVNLRDLFALKLPRNGTGSPEN